MLPQKYNTSYRKIYFLTKFFEKNKIIPSFFLNQIFLYLLDIKNQLKNILIVVQTSFKN